MGGNQVLSITLKGERQREREGGGGVVVVRGSGRGPDCQGRKNNN